jgi:hypothetical protein
VAGYLYYYIEYKYLGILMGAIVKLEDIFRNKTNQIWDLTMTSLPALRKLKREDRIKAFNIFAYPKLVYLLGFFPFPINEAKGSVMHTFNTARAIYTTRFYGSAYHMEILLTGPDQFGIKPAVKDPWTYGLANLIDQNNLDAWNGSDQEDVEFNLNALTSSMIISDLRNSCGDEYVCQVIAYNNHYFPPSEASHTFQAEDHLVMEGEKDSMTVSKKKTRDKFYLTALVNGHRYTGEMKLAAAIERRIPGLNTGEMILFLHEHQRLNSQLWNYYTNIQVDLIENALSTDRRWLPTTSRGKAMPRQVRLDSTARQLLSLP